MKMKIKRTEILEIEIPAKYALPYINKEDTKGELLDYLEDECIIDELDTYVEDSHTEILETDLQEINFFREYEVFSKGLEITNEYINSKECYLLKDRKLIPIYENIKDECYLVVNRKKLGSPKGETLEDWDMDSIEELDHWAYWIDLENLEYCIVQNMEEDKMQNVINNNLGYFVCPSIL